MPTAVVTIETISHATEGGASAVVRLTRSDTTGGLTVDLSYAGSATRYDDYDGWLTPVFSSVAFLTGVATADIDVPAIDDGDSEPTETVTVTIDAGSG